ncbi:uncharacterized protein LOC116182149 isoform X2 [Photinus pyralis]|uniref:uncharacterized protein LOC116182149 isoform X2 n=1 Tax=Photinus pyralis TaxID=7054 RepID=UPI001266F4F7|nr:uncharacterized protein LOC116182149 isoform X2 [Photinus pyralis]
MFIIMDNIPSTKRPRSTNWDETEKEVFLECLRPELNIIENKKKLTVLNKDKNSAWQRIQRKMKVEGYNRDVHRMKEQWLRVKQQAKRNVGQYKRQAKLTGGGPPPPEPTDFDWKIKDMIPHDFVEDSSCFDSDTTPVLPANAENTQISCSTSELEKHVPLTSQQEKYQPSSSQGEKFQPSSCMSKNPPYSKRYDHNYVTESFSDDKVLQLDEYEEIIEETGTCDMDDEEDNNVTGEQTPKAAPLKKRGQVKMKAMTQYERQLLKLNEKRIAQMMRHAEELHALKKQNENKLFQEQLKRLGGSIPDTEGSF